MPQALAAIGAFFVSTGVIATVVKTILINVALGALTKALTKKPKYTAPPINITVKNTIENRRLVFGKRRAGGTFVFYGVKSTSGSSTKNELWYVVVYTGHEVNAIRDVWLDTERIADADISAGTVTGGKFAGKAWVWRYTGTSAQAVDAGMNTGFPTEWDSDHRLRGCAYAVILLSRDDAVFPSGAPQSVTALIEGAKLYDPRLDSTNGGSGSHRRDDPSTWAYSTNPALSYRWYLSGGSVHNDLTSRLVRYGLREIDSRINDAYVTAAANICDQSITGASEPPSGAQNRYECNLEVSTGEDRRTILEAILATMAGTSVYVQGQWRVYAGAYDAPLHTLTQDDLYGDIESEDTTSHENRYNQVAGVFIDAAQQYVEQTTIFRTDSAYETQDGGEPIPREIDLRGVTDQYQAQRLAEIDLRKSRMMRIIKIRGARNLLKIAPNETFNLSHSRWSWSSRVFRCIEREFEFTEEAGRVVITARREDAAVYADMATADYDTGTSATDQFVLDGPDAPTALTATGIPGGVWLSWTDPTFKRGGTLVFELYEHSAVTPFSSAVKVWEGRASQVILNYVTPGTRYFWVRSKYSTGQVSATEPATNGLAGTPTTTFLTGGNCEVIGSVARKNGGSSSWDSHVYSRESYLDGAQVTFRADQTNARVVVGLNSDPTTDQSYSSIDYAFHCQDNGTLDIYESNTEVVSNISGGYSTSTVLTVRHDGRRIQYIRDGVVVREVIHGVGAFFMDSSFYTPGGQISSLYFGPANPVRPNPWVARGNCEAGVTYARKNGGSSAWDSDVYSVESYPVCHLKYKPNQTSANIMVGLSLDPLASQSYLDINYTWYAESTGDLHIYESGSLISSHGTYSTSTELAITYDAASVRYYKDRVLIRTVGTSNKIFYADSSFFNPGAAVNSLQFGPGTSLETVNTPGIEPDAATDVYVRTTASASTSGVGEQIADTLTFTAAADGQVVATIETEFDYVSGGGGITSAYAGVRIYDDSVLAFSSSGVDVTLNSGLPGHAVLRGVIDVAAGSTVDVKLFTLAKPGGANASVNFSNIEMSVEFIKR